MPRFSTLNDISRHATLAYATRPALADKRAGGYTFITYRELGDRIDELRGGLAALGVKRGDRVAVISDNCTAWAVGLFATVGLGAWWVPMYESQAPDECALILRDSGASVVCLGSPKVAARLAAHLDAIPEIRHRIVLRPDGPLPSGALSFDEVRARGRAAPVPRAEVTPDDVAVLIYTSGTTGVPKGVMLTHGNLASNVDAVLATFPLDPNGETSLAFLPWAHSYGLTAELLVGTAHGGAAAIIDSPNNLVTDLPIVRPTVLLSVPRVWNKLYAGLNARMAAEGGIKKALFERAMLVAARREERAAAGRRPSLRLEVQHRLLDRLVFGKVRAAFGGRLKYALSGAAALSPDVARFLQRIGLTVCEGYGLTETSPIVANNRPGTIRIGTVGFPLPGVTVQIRPVEDAPEGQGEVVVKGPNVMKGYYNRPEETAAMIGPDGFLRTGDLGMIDADGYLKITGRIKEQFKLENGKFVAPAPLEEELKLCPLIAHALVYGVNRPYTVALIFPDREALAKWAKEHGLDGRDHEALCRDPHVRNYFASEIERLSADWKGYEKPAAFAVLPDEISIENGLMTPSLKLKRRKIVDKLATEIDALYADRRAVRPAS
jgi:long-chain acyl-CoA synthetase